jgi:hypothetical protein
VARSGEPCLTVAKRRVLGIYPPSLSNPYRKSRKPVGLMAVGEWRQEEVDDRGIQVVSGEGWTALHTTPALQSQIATPCSPFSLRWA